MLSAGPSRQRYLADGSLQWHEGWTTGRAYCAWPSQGGLSSARGSPMFGERDTGDQRTPRFTNPADLCGRGEEWHGSACRGWPDAIHEPQRPNVPMGRRIRIVMADLRFILTSVCGTVAQRRDRDRRFADHLAYLWCRGVGAQCCEDHRRYYRS
jgi:hypothetical protein